MNPNDNVLNWPFFRETHFSDKSATEFYSLRTNWGWFLAEGIALTALGFIAISFSLSATIMSVAFLGWLFLFAGIVQSIRAFSTKRWSGSFVKILAAVLYVVAGILIIQSPTTTALMLTFLIAPLFIVCGIVKMISTITTRSPQWGWGALSGAMGVVLGILIWNQWPSSGTWVIGTLVGIEMLFSGISVVTFALALKALSIASGRGEKVAA
jgi:uncharacterized membrane protein HdeD (DUF308 family)